MRQITNIAWLLILRILFILVYFSKESLELKFWISKVNQQTDVDPSCYQVVYYLSLMLGCNRFNRLQLH